MTAPDALIAMLEKDATDRDTPYFCRDSLTQAAAALAALTAENAMQHEGLRQGAAKIESLEAALRQAVEALRGEVIHGMTKDPRAYGISHHLCQLCKHDWLAEGPESHAHGCLAAPAAAPGEKP